MRILLTSTLLLLLNDHYLKQQFSNAITGKLSDLCGLVVLGGLLVYFFPRKKVLVLFLTAVFFIWWKTPLSSSTISRINEYTGLGFARVIDYTDLWCLFVLIPVYYLNFRLEKFHLFFRTGFYVLVLVAFVATSMPRFVLYPDWTYSESTLLPYSRSFFLNKKMSPNYSLDSTLLESNELEISLFLDRSYTIWAELTPLDSTLVFKMTHLKMVEGDGDAPKDLTRDKFLAYYQSQIVPTLLDTTAKPYYLYRFR